MPRQAATATPLHYHYENEKEEAPGNSGKGKDEKGMKKSRCGVVWSEKNPPMESKLGPRE